MTSVAHFERAIRIARTAVPKSVIAHSSIARTDVMGAPSLRERVGIIRRFWAALA
jgi:hypothetical protein